MADELLNSLNLNDLMGNTAKTQVADEIVETKEEYYDVVKYKDELGSFIKQKRTILLVLFYKFIFCNSMSAVPFVEAINKVY